MNSPLKDMSLEALWQLFPIVLKPHNPLYNQWYELQAQAIGHMDEQQEIFRLSHIGSTAVKGLLSKPIVDILLELNLGSDAMRWVKRLERDGWLLMSEAHEPPWKWSFNKGYTPQGFAQKVYHLHVQYASDPDELYFRDYLREHKEVAEAYAALKLRLGKTYEHDRDGYTLAKTDFIGSYSQLAREQYGARYGCGEDI